MEQHGPNLDFAGRVNSLTLSSPLQKIEAGLFSSRPYHRLLLCYFRAGGNRGQRDMLPLLSSRWSLTDVEVEYLLLPSSVVPSLAGCSPETGFLVRFSCHDRQRPRCNGDWRLLLIRRLGWVRASGSCSLWRWRRIMQSLRESSHSKAQLGPPCGSKLPHTCFGVLGIGLPLPGRMVSASVSQHDAIALDLAAVLFLLAIGVIGLSIPDTFRDNPPRPPAPGFWKNPVLPVLACLFFIYLATENSVSGWLASDAQRAQITHGTYWAIVPAFFWGALLLGRATGHLLVRRVNELDALRIQSLLSAAGIAALVASSGMPAILFGALAAGFGLSTLFPAFINILSRTFRTNAPQAGSLLFALAGLGGAFGPFMVGVVSEHFSLRAGFLVPLMGCIAIYLLCAPRRRYWTFHSAQ